MKEIFSILEDLEGEGLSGISRASLWFDNVDAWSSQLQKGYSFYSDIIEPIILALLEIQQGLSFITASKVTMQTSADSSQALQNLTQGLLIYPPLLDISFEMSDSESTSSESSSQQAAKYLPASCLSQGGILAILSKSMKEKELTVRKECHGNIDVKFLFECLYISLVVCARIKFTELILGTFHRRLEMVEAILLKPPMRTAVIEHENIESAFCEADVTINFWTFSK